MDFFSPIYGLVTRHDPVSENAGLFFLHYLVLKLMLGQHVSLNDYQLFYSKMDNSKVANGLYRRNKTLVDRTVSHDEITGMIGTAYIIGSHHDIDIAHYLVSNYGNYPATGVNKYYNPANYYAWLTLTGYKLAFLFAPLYTINLLITSNKEPGNTSSKLMYLDELYLLKDVSFYGKILWTYYVWRMKLMYGEKWIRSLFDIYFASEDMTHPLRDLSHKI